MDIPVKFRKVRIGRYEVLQLNLGAPFVGWVERSDRSLWPSDRWWATSETGKIVGHASTRDDAASMLLDGKEH